MQRMVFKSFNQSVIFVVDIALFFVLVGYFYDFSCIKKLKYTQNCLKNVDFFKPYLWDEKLHGGILCEGAQGFWLDVTHGYYPYVTSSTTLPYGACSLGFSPKLIRNIYNYD